MASSFDDFVGAVRASVDEHARRKGYTEHGADGENRLLEVSRLMGFGEAHGIGEIVYKCAEYLAGPRRVLLEKIAGWAFVLWRGGEQEDPGQATLPPGWLADQGAEYCWACRNMKVNCCCIGMRK